VAHNPNMRIIDIAIEYGPGFLTLNIWRTLAQLCYILHYLDIKEEVLQIVEMEMERMSNNPLLEGLTIQKKNRS
jgi:hypothetical protein